MNKIYYTELGTYMMAQGLTAKDVAKKCNVGLKAVYNWINKVHKPNNVKTLIKLASVLKIEVEVLKDYFKEV